MTKLYELTGQLMELQNLDLDPELLADTVEAVEGELELKAESLLQVVSNMDSDVDQIDQEIKRLTARKKAVKNRQDWLREYLRSNMEVAGIDKISCPLWTITLRKPTVVVSVVDVFLLPSEYQKHTIVADKTAIKNALKAGTDVPGATLIDGKRGLIIK